MINSTLINSALDVAQEVFSSRTGDELQGLKEHFGKAYSEIRIVSEIAIKLIMRLTYNIQVSRELTPITLLVLEAEHTYRTRYDVNAPA
jgi:hypothetical protein